MCAHNPPCPAADQAEARRACVVARHEKQGWRLLCNGVVVFEDTGELLPDGRAVEPPPRPLRAA
jgi:hypothetical protein